MAIRSPYAVPCEGEYGLPHRRARRFAMTRVFGGAVGVGGGVRAPRPTEGGKEVRCRRVVGEIGEAPPVAEEASRFRGSAPIGDHDSGRESVGTMVGNRRPLRKQQCALCPAVAGAGHDRAAAHTGAALRRI